MGVDELWSTDLTTALRKHTAGGLGSCGFVVGWIEDYTAVEALAVAFSAEIRLVAQGKVNDAALA